MKSRPLFWYIFIGTVFITLSLIWALTFFFYTELKDFYFQEERQNLLRSAKILHEEASQSFCSGKDSGLDNLFERIGQRTSVRITLLNPNGKVIADSESIAGRINSHKNSPEIKEAISGKEGWAIRYSTTLDRDMLYVAIPIRCTALGPTDHLSGAKGVLRLSVPLASLEDKLFSFQAKIFLGIVLALLFAVVIAFLVSRWISWPLQEIKTMAMEFAKGNLDQRFGQRDRGPVSQEILSLKNSLIHMARQLQKRFGQLQQQKNQLELVFASMKEAVIVVDRDGKIKSINSAASSLFNIGPDYYIGMSVFSAIRNLDMQRHLKQVFATWQDREEEIVFSLEQDYSKKRYFYVRTVVLKNQHGVATGVLLVMDDLTRMKRLESIRRDFVSNVSHELKTPITSIKGYVETLLDGAFQDAEHADEFLRVIAKQAKHLEAIVEDLLCLSRIEIEADGPRISMESQDICPILRAAIDTCRLRAKEKDITIECECKSPLKLEINARLLEQALTNLIINAVKYSRKGKKIIVRAKKTTAPGSTSQAIISVQDFGVGISSEHRDRIFERFYRVDKARSRKLGGTGLGLAIVKHIAQLHGGRVGLKSRLGKGSTFFIYLPIKG